MGVKKLPMNGEGGEEGRGESVSRPCSFGKRHYVCFQKGLFLPPSCIYGEGTVPCVRSRERERELLRNIHTNVPLLTFAWCDSLKKKRRGGKYFTALDHITLFLPPLLFPGKWVICSFSFREPFEISSYLWRRASTRSTQAESVSLSYHKSAFPLASPPLPEGKNFFWEQLCRKSKKKV